MTQKKVPDISIEDALELFLSLAKPMPNGEGKQALVSQLKDQIAKDRPEWAQADNNQVSDTGQAGVVDRSTAPGKSRRLEPENQSNTTKHTKNCSERDYTSVKQSHINAAQQEEVPSDPEERFFYNREKEAEANLRKRREDEEYLAEKEKLQRKCLTPHPEEYDKGLVERALKIKQLILARMQNTLEHISLENGTTGITHDPRDHRITLEKNITDKPDSVKRTKLQHEKPDRETAKGIPPLVHKPENKKNNKQISKPLTVNPGSSPPKPSLPIHKDESIQLKIEALRQFNEARKNNLKSKKQLLWPRKPLNPETEYQKKMGITIETETSNEKQHALADLPRKKQYKNDIYQLNDKKKNNDEVMRLDLDKESKAHSGLKNSFKTSDTTSIFTMDIE